MKHTIEKTRREYNQWVADETLEDYALRYSPSGFRKWSPLLLANTALGGISFLALEAIGAVLLLNYGFSNAFWAIMLASVLIFIAGFPISYYAARYNIDIDLLTRSAGFGYVGSTVTSLIYASFCFIFFALEAAIMAQALKLYFHLPLQWGYLLCSLVIIPIVFYGVTAINQLHRWTQPVWLLLMFLPFYFVFSKEPNALVFLLNYKGDISDSNQFDGYYFGIATGISFALIAQIGEQVDYLRFMPDKNKANRFIWWTSLTLAGPGWVILGCLKQLGGALLASLVVMTGLGMAEAKEPVQMYWVAYRYVFEHSDTALLITTIFVIISQIKINVTNAYAGSLAWSNFFSRVTHNHPGRVVWLVFNIGIALLLMELGVFEVLHKVLGLYSNVAVAWVFAVFADLVINKPLKLSPAIVEFKRAHLYNFNPVGFLSMLIASFLSILAFSGLFGSYAQAYSWLFAMLLSLTLSPLIAILTKGKYYIARGNEHFVSSDDLVVCGVCEQHYAETDMAHCPFHEVPICSLCCTLESNCRDQCKPTQESLYHRLLASLLGLLFKQGILDNVVRRISNFMLVSGGMLSVLGLAFWLVYSDIVGGANAPLFDEQVAHIYSLLGFITVLVCIAAWWIILAHESRFLAETELNEQNETLDREVKERKKAEASLRESEVAFRKLFEYSGDPVLLIKNGCFYDGNISALSELGLHSKKQLCNIAPASISPEFQSDGRNSVEKSTQMIAIAQEQGFHRFEWEHVKTDGTVFPVEVSLTPMLVGGEDIVYAAWRNISVRKENEEALRQRTNEIRLHNDVLQLINAGEALNSLLNQFLNKIEQLHPHMLCSVLLLDAEGKHLKLGAAPSLPNSYNQAIDGLEIGNGVGSCGTAAFLKKTVIVQDIQQHPYWQPYRMLAQKAGLAACWSQPIFSSQDRKVLGTIAIYHRIPAKPTAKELELFNGYANLVALAIEYDYAQLELCIAAKAFDVQEGITVTDASTNILKVNQSFCDITGYSAEEAIGNKPSILKSTLHDDSFYHAMWKSLKTSGSWQGEIWNRRKNGEVYPEWLKIDAVKDGEQNVTNYVASFSDITLRKQAEQEIKQLAYYDPLTKLPNRRYLHGHIDQYIARANRELTEFAVFMLDLDRFKAVNDTLGHLAGDELLKQVAGRISEQLRETDVVARLGGDEFMVLLENIEHIEDVGRIAEKIVSSLSIPFVLTQSDDVRIGASIGICLYPEQGTSYEKLMDHADMALYQAKDSGRGCFAFFSDSLTQLAREKLKIEARLRYAIKNQELRVFYQPQVDICSGKIIGAEALVRWQDPENGLVPPGQFIPIAEEAGLIISLGEWVLNEACRQGKQWLDQGLAKITIAVNVSPKQFQGSSMVAVVKNALRKTGFPADLLELELTEGSLMAHQEESIKVLGELRALGVRLAMDDFGTGYSSLAYLKRFPLDVLKIDKSFIDDIPYDKSDMEISATIIAMGKTLNFKVLAEGVETEEQLAFLQQNGCDSYQGYYKSRPLDREAFAKFLGLAG